MAASQTTRLRWKTSWPTSVAAITLARRSAGVGSPGDIAGRLQHRDLPADRGQVQHLLLGEGGQPRRTAGDDPDQQHVYRPVQRRFQRQPLVEHVPQAVVLAE